MTVSLTRMSRNTHVALRDPVAVFNADTNVEAQLVRTLLVDAGVEAFVVEDV